MNRREKRKLSKDAKSLWVAKVRNGELSQGETVSAAELDAEQDEHARLQAIWRFYRKVEERQSEKDNPLMRDGR